MYLTCDATIETSDGQVFEWVLFIRAACYADSVGFVEQVILDRWGHTVQIKELCVSPDANSLEKQASSDDETCGIYATRHPRELVQHIPLLTKFMRRLSRKRGYPCTARTGRTERPS